MSIKPIRVIIDIENNLVTEREWTDKEISDHAVLVENTIIPTLEKFDGLLNLI